jgi:hypothetical protein
LIDAGQSWFIHITTLAIKALRAAAWVSGAFLLKTMATDCHWRAIGSFHFDLTARRRSQ